jgi:hypothetical protein
MLLWAPGPVAVAVFVPQETTAGSKVPALAQVMQSRAIGIAAGGYALPAVIQLPVQAFFRRKVVQ